jgi:hypothetical protein
MRAAYTPVESFGKRAIVIFRRMGIPKLARVVCVITSILHPDWQVAIVDSLFYNSGISAYFRLVPDGLLYPSGPLSHRMEETRR